LAGCELRGVVRGEPGNPAARAWSAEPELAHVREIEHPARRPNALVLVEDRAVLDRHLPPGEWDHPRAERAVLVEQRCAPQFFAHRRSFHTAIARSRICR